MVEWLVDRLENERVEMKGSGMVSISAVQLAFAMAGMSALKKVVQWAAQ